MRGKKGGEENFNLSNKRDREKSGLFLYVYFLSRWSIKKFISLDFFE